ncbi:MAG: hypothetical protein IJ752_08775 [Alphaproteobacteria bacterium]|nr:hypothetical protein [Alphaproteobacteria bacterium]
MTDLVEDFLNEAAAQLSDLEGLLPVLETNPQQEDCWEVLCSFLDFVRSVAPFVGFQRSYRLSDAGGREIREYLKKRQNSSVLPAALAKFQRVRDILTAAERLKREIRESDDDLLPPAAAEIPAFGAVQIKTASVPDVTAQEAALDKREEELVLWAQALTEQEDILKRKENILFKEENVQTVAQKKIDDALNRLSEQERIQSDLEDHLAETRLELQSCQEKLADQEEARKRSERLLETKDMALNDMSRKIQDLTRLLEEKNSISEQREEQLYRELQKNREKNAELQSNLELLEETRLEAGENQEKIFVQYAQLEKEYQDISRRLEEEKENKEQMLKEKRELEKQHLEFNTRMIVLQEKLGIEKENVKRAEMLLEQQKRRGEVVQSELRAAGWPYDTEKIQKELALLARQEGARSVTNSLIALKELIGQMRTRSFVKIPSFFKSMAQTTAKQHQRSYEIASNCSVIGGVDKDALAVLEQMLVPLTDNSFRYAFPKDRGETLRLNLSVREEGAFLRCSFFDNGGSFDFDRLYKAVQAAGLANENTDLDRSDLLTYLFHSSVAFHAGPRGLTNAVQLLEKSGGQVSVDSDHGLKVHFSIPKRFLFDKALLFRLSGQLLALPLNAVAETVFLKEGDIKRDGEGRGSFFYWKGNALPVLKLDSAEQNNFGLVVQAGVFGFLLPVQQILDTEALLSFSDQTAENNCPYLVPCTVLESGREPLWLDIAELMKQVVLPLPKKIVSFSEEVQSNAVQAKHVSYLVFKSEPSVFGAVRVNAVLRVEDFPTPSNETVYKKVLETQGRRLLLKDSCPREHYPYAQAILIFETFALAIHEVADIVEVPNVDTQDGNVDFILYSGRKVPVFSTEL